MNKTTNSPESSNDGPKIATELFESEDTHNSDLSHKQERFLELVDYEDVLPKNIGSSEEPSISYFGISYKDGILPFNKDGQDLIHYIMSNDSKENIKSADEKWTNILYQEVLDIETKKSYSDIEVRRSKSLAVIMNEKNMVSKLLSSLSNELKIIRNPKITTDPNAKYPDSYSKIEILNIKENTRMANEKNNKIKDAAFREFALRRGWYKSKDVFDYLDNRDNINDRGLNYFPKFAEQLSKNEYQQWLNDMYRANKNSLNSNERATDGTKTKYITAKYDENGQPVLREKVVGKSTQDLIKKVGTSNIPEAEKINQEMREFITIAKEYEERKKYWLSGSFAIDDENVLRELQYTPFIKYNEVLRVNRYFKNLATKGDSNNQDKSMLMVKELKKKLGIQAFGDIELDEVYLLPTGLTAFKDNEMLAKTQPATNISLEDIDSDISKATLLHSWVDYTKQNQKNDNTRFAVVINKYIDHIIPHDEAQELFNKYNIEFKEKLINEETGGFEPSFRTTDYAPLESFFKKYGQLISAAKFDNGDQRYKNSIDDWRDDMTKYIFSINTKSPSFLQDAFSINETGLQINLSNIPLDFYDDLDTFGLATQFAIWDNLSSITKNDFFELQGTKLNVNQKFFVKTFGRFVYGENTRKELVGRAYFFDQFKKWQDNELDNDKNKFYDQFIKKNNKQ